MKYTSEENEKKALFEVARLMVTAARTAPKAKGVDNILTLVVYGGEKDAIVAEMNRIAEDMQNPVFTRDAKSVDASEYVIFLAVRDNHALLPFCGNCGFEDCEKAKAAGSPCVFNISDLGTAACAASVVAANHFVDNRMMYTVGSAAKSIGLFGTEIRLCYGIPISAGGKNIYFDRK